MEGHVKWCILGNVILKSTSWRGYMEGSQDYDQSAEGMARTTKLDLEQRLGDVMAGCHLVHHCFVGHAADVATKLQKAPTGRRYVRSIGKSYPAEFLVFGCQVCHRAPGETQTLEHGLVNVSLLTSIHVHVRCHRSKQERVRKKEGTSDALCTRQSDAVLALSAISSWLRCGRAGEERHIPRGPPVRLL